MSLQAAEFFAELCLPFTNGTVVGNTYYATPIQDAPLRLRIRFTPTLYADTYGGLQATVLHADNGVTASHPELYALAPGWPSPAAAATRALTLSGEGGCARCDE
ncbi:hypothetical protein [Streptomyces noursei]|uniref:hypothetical protein n=1 Tax=Streptomyces noursei TaxID=1971 RepID=UPI0039B0D192